MKREYSIQKDNTENVDSFRWDRVQAEKWSAPMGAIIRHFWMSKRNEWST